MEQAIHTVTPAALSSGTQPERPEHEGVAHALAVAGRLLAQLSLLPFATEVAENHPGWRVQLKFRDTRAQGVLRLAELVDTGVSRNESPFGVHYEALARIEGVEVLASALLSFVQAAEFDASATDAADEPTDTEEQEQDEAEGEGEQVAEPVDAGPASVVPLGSAVFNRSAVATGSRAEQ